MIAKAKDKDGNNKFVALRGGNCGSYQSEQFNKLFNDYVSYNDKFFSIIDVIPEKNITINEKFIRTCLMIKPSTDVKLPLLELQVTSDKTVL